MAAAFGDPTRRDIFLHVRAVPGVTAREVATTFSLHPNVARHHLQRLVDGGYLRVETGRNAAGAGRPSKRYFCVEEELSLGLMQRRDDLLMRLLGEAMRRLGPAEAEEMAALVGEEYGRSLASRMTPTEGQRTVRAAMHVVAETLTAHGFAAHAEDRGETTAVVAEQCPFGDASSTNPVLCAVDRGMVKGSLAGLCGTASTGAPGDPFVAGTGRRHLHRLCLSPGGSRLPRPRQHDSASARGAGGAARLGRPPAGDPGRLHEEGRTVRDALERHEHRCRSSSAWCRARWSSPRGEPRRSTPPSGAPPAPRRARRCSAPRSSTLRSATLGPCRAGGGARGRRDRPPRHGRAA